MLVFSEMSQDELVVLQQLAADSSIPEYEDNEMRYEDIVNGHEALPISHAGGEFEALAGDFRTSCVFILLLYCIFLIKCSSG